MPIPKSRQALDTDLKKSLSMGLDECHIALRESYADLVDEHFWQHGLEGRHNVVTVVMHCLQQHDEFNGHLQRTRAVPARHEWQFMEHEERFKLWGIPPETLPKPGDTFPRVEEVLRSHDELHGHMIENIGALTEDELVANGVGQWPRLCDMFFRGTYHVNAHIRQIWLLRGAMGVLGAFPQQHYA